MILALLSVFAGEYQYLLMDAENFGMGGVRTAHPFSVFDNPAISAITYPFFSVDGAWNYMGLSSSAEIKGGYNLDRTKGLGFVFFYNNVSGIPDTRGALIDENGNGELDPGEEIDSTRITYFSAYQSLFIFGMAEKYGEFSIGFNIKLFHEKIGNDRGIGGGFDIGILFVKEKLVAGLCVRDVTHSPIFWERTIEKIPPAYSVGGTYSFSLDNGDLTFSMEGVLDEGGITPHIGVKYVFKETVMATAGIDRGMFSTGIGFHLKNTRISYALKWHSALNISHMVTISKGFYK